MKLKDFIEKLQKLQKTVGEDAEVLVREDGFGGHSMHVLGSVVEDEIGVFEIEDCDESEIFPNWDGNEDLTTKCITISSGIRLYST